MGKLVLSRYSGVSRQAINMEDRVKLVVGFITYGESTAKYLPYFLPSLKTALKRFDRFTSGRTACAVLCFDNSEDGEKENMEYIKKNYPEIKIIREGHNLGFAKAYNKMIKRAGELGAEYFLAINPDTVLAPDAVEKMVKAMDNDKSFGSASPKVFKWDFAKNEKTDIIDTLGVKLSPGLRFVDAERGKTDKEARRNEKIIGPSGAAGLYRLSALEKIKQDGQYFDELMFMYKEDCDLAYRLFLAGFKSMRVDEAVIYHDRSVGAKGEGDLSIAFNRKNKSRQAKKWSFLGQQIIFVKYWSLQSFKDKLAIVWRQMKILVFILFFEPYLLRELVNFAKIQNKIKIYK